MSHTPAHLTNLESALAGLAPSEARINRDRLLYEAGKLAAPRSLRWPIATSMFALLSLGLGLQLFLQPSPRTMQVVYVAAPAPHHESGSPFAVMESNDTKWGNAFRPSAGYLSRRDQVLHFGADALPAAPSSPGAPLEPTQELKALHRSI